MAFFTLVHSPLVGPATWSRVGAELRRLGHSVVVPSLLDAALTGRWEACVVAAVRDVTEEIDDHVLVGHSGAGTLLPVVASRLRVPPRFIVFVDAVLPPAEGDARLMPEAFLDQLRRSSTEGRLPKWSEWFGPDTMRVLVPDPKLRDEVTNELPELPLAYFERSVPMPSAWTQIDCGYVLLSEAYRDHAAEARSRRWPTLEVLGTHLDIVNRPSAVASSILEIVSA